LLHGSEFVVAEDYLTTVLSYALQTYYRLSDGAEIIGLAFMID